MSIPVRLRIPRRLLDEMLAHALQEAPNECCGILAGSAATGKVTHLYRLVNAAASPFRYAAEDDSLFQAYRAMRATETDHLAIYHSHTFTEPIPSRTDLEQNFYGSGIVHLIISLKRNEPVVRGWRLGEKDFQEAEWECVGNDECPMTNDERRTNAQ